MTRSRSILVTGGAGFIGSHLVDRLLEEGGWQVTVLDNFDPFYGRAIKEANLAPHFGRSDLRVVEGDILNDSALDEVFAGGQEVVVHLAAKAGVRPSLADPVGYHRVNATGTQKLLERAGRGQTSHFVLASSSSVYGVDPNVPWREVEGRYLKPISPYAESKIAAEAYAQAHSHSFGARVTALRFFTAYGPRQRPDLAIHQFFRKIRAGVPIPQFGDGTTRRDYTFVADIISGVRNAIDREKGGEFEVYNLGNSETVMLRDLIAAVQEEIGLKAIIDRHPDQPGDVPQTYADVSKAGEHFGYAPVTPLTAGLASFHDWLRKGNF